jgi:V/A-type H+/Na+-transporting ATPase subunit E
MAEDLQSLLDRIRKDGVAQARKEADAILADAREKAARIVDDAKTAAADRVKAAEAQAEQFEARARDSLKQAARDVVLSVGAAINRTAQALVAQRVATTLSGDGLGAVIATAVNAYFAASDSREASVLLPEKDVEAVRRYLAGELADALLAGLEIKADRSIVAGFTIAEAGDEVRHSFTGEDITAALCKLLRPDLAEIVKAAMETETSAAP